MHASVAAAHTIRVARNLPFTPAEVAEYLFAPEVVHQWLGASAALRPELGATASLPQAAPHRGREILYLAPCPGRVSALAWPVPGSSPPNTASHHELVVALDTGAATPSQVAIRLAPRAAGGCRLRIAQSGLPSADARHAMVRVWQAALDAADHLLAQLRWRHRHERQAIIVVHGIGEQRPGQLLREFVDNIFPDKDRELRFVKPDRLSSLFEMRMVTVPRNDATRPTTDVYELYWAHLIRDTTLAQVYGWMLRLLLSKDTVIPRPLLRAVWALRIGLVLALAALAWLAGTDVSAWLKGLGLGALAALPALGKRLLAALGNEFVVGYAGDAARYLEPRAGNIARRQDIREEGANLLDALHDQKRYARIIVYGHSLGSVIAYDILAHAWARRFRQRDGVRRTSSRALNRLEDLLNPRAGQTSVPDANEIQDLQHAAWLEYQRNGFQWRVSDLVTVGSPLAHAAWLLKLDARTGFDDLKRERSFPTCPPQTEARRSPLPGATRQAFTFTHAYTDPQHPKAKCSVQVPHHAGLFAITRWTNLYFPFHGLLDGDPVAGPLQQPFGRWIKDVKLRDTHGFAHCRYTDYAAEPGAVSLVRQALHLPLQRPLADYAAPPGRPAQGD